MNLIIQNSIVFFPTFIKSIRCSKFKMNLDIPSNNAPNKNVRMRISEICSQLHYYPPYPRLLNFFLLSASFYAQNPGQIVPILPRLQSNAKHEQNFPVG